MNATLYERADWIQKEADGLWEAINSGMVAGNEKLTMNCRDLAGMVERLAGIVMGLAEPSNPSANAAAPGPRPLCCPSCGSPVNVELDANLSGEVVPVGIECSDLDCDARWRTDGSPK